MMKSQFIFCSVAHNLKGLMTVWPQDYFKKRTGCVRGQSTTGLYYLINLSISLNLGWSPRRNHSKITISEVTISAPAARARSMAIALL